MSKTVATNQKPRKSLTIIRKIIVWAVVLFAVLGVASNAAVLLRHGTPNYGGVLLFASLALAALVWDSTKLASQARLLLGIAAIGAIAGIVIMVKFINKEPSAIERVTEQRADVKTAYVKKCADIAEAQQVSRGLAENLCGCAYEKQYVSSALNKPLTQEEALKECYAN